MATHILADWYSDQDKARLRAQVEVSLTDTPQGPRLSIVGSVTSSRNRSGDWVTGGQISALVRGLAEHPDWLVEGWTPERIRSLADIWDAWHLNDMRAGCQHQRALGWRSCSGYSDCDILSMHASPDRRAGIYVEEAAAGRTVYAYNPGASTASYCVDKVGKPCPECGYRFGSQWLYEPLPAEVLRAVKRLV